MLTTLDSLFFVHSHRDLKISVIIYWQHKLLWVRILKLAKTCTAAACAHAYNACEFKGITTRQDHIAFLSWIVLSCFTFFFAFDSCSNRKTQHLGRCKTSSFGQSAGLSIPRSSVRVRQNPQKTESSNLHRFELHRPSSKGTKLLFQVIKAIVNQ